MNTSCATGCNTLVPHPDDPVRGHESKLWGELVMKLPPFAVELLKPRNIAIEAGAAVAGIAVVQTASTKTAAHAGDGKQDAWD